METAPSNLPRKALLACLAAVFAVGSCFLADYLRLQPAMAARLVFFALALLSLFALQRNGGMRPRKAELFAFGVFALLFDVSLVLGRHIVVGDTYSGLMDENYIEPYSALDAIAFLFMFALLFLYSLALYRFLAGPHRATSDADAAKTATDQRINVRIVIVVAVILFLLWLPYLVVYYPGFVFGDTMNSIRQIVGEEGFSNRHPLAFTLCLGLCLHAAEAVGLGATEGIALFCVLQMTFMAACLAYFSAWVVARGSITGKARWIVVALMAAFFGLNPYFSTYTIALWKDPVFSIAVLMLTLFLADIVLALTGSAQRMSRGKLVAVLVFSLLVAFFRNNGAYLLLLSAVALGAVLLKSRRKRPAKRKFTRAESTQPDAVSAEDPSAEAWSAGKQPQPARDATLAASARPHSSDSKPKPAGNARRMACWSTAILLVVAASYFALIIPGFKLLGISGAPSSETVGIPLNQMARVAAVGGDMTEEDRAYLDSILPLELYPETYRPCCVDLLKWSGDYNSTAMKTGIIQHWPSLLLRNPVVFFEAWELQTFGFWAVNQPAIMEFNNIAGGSLRSEEQLAAYGIDGTKGIDNELARQLFPQDEAGIPVGAVFWAMLYLAVCLCLAGKARWLVALAPAFGLMATLFVASPIWYWPRYALAVQILVPFFVLLFYLIAKGRPAACRTA